MQPMSVTSLNEKCRVQYNTYRKEMNNLNTRLLKSKMVLCGDTNVTLAEALKISPQRLSAKINEWEGAEFTQSEILIIKDRYHLTPEEVDAIFFTTKSS